MINVITDHEISVILNTLKSAKSLARWGDDEELMNECQTCIEMLRNMKQASADSLIR